MTAAIDLINQALYRLGEKPITSVDEGTRVADACKSLYPPTRDTLLSYQPWPFATVRQALARLTATPPSRYAYYYALPTEPAILWIKDIDTANQPFTREVYVDPLDAIAQTPVIATNATSVILTYTGRVEEAIFPPIVQNTLAIWLAANLAPAISGKASLRQSLLQELTLVLDRLTDRSGHEDWPRRIPQATTYNDVRSGGGNAAEITYAERF